MCSGLAIARTVTTVNSAAVTEFPGISTRGFCLIKPNLAAGGVAAVTADARRILAVWTPVSKDGRACLSSAETTTVPGWSASPSQGRRLLRIDVSAGAARGRCDASGRGGSFPGKGARGGHHPRPGCRNQCGRVTLNSLRPLSTVRTTIPQSQAALLLDRAADSQPEHRISVVAVFRLGQFRIVIDGLEGIGQPGLLDEFVPV